MMFNLLS